MLSANWDRREPDEHWLDIIIDARDLLVEAVELAYSGRDSEVADLVQKASALLSRESVVVGFK